MNISGVRKKLNRAFGGAVHAELADGAVRLSGSLPDWESAVSACYMAAEKYSRIHVVNDIEIPGLEIPPMRIPPACDDTLEGFSPDVLVIGGGISGAAILRELSRSRLSILLVDKEADLAMQASGRNDGEVHPGVDLGDRSLKHTYVLRGNAMMGRLCKDLDVPFTRCGQYVGFKDAALMPLVQAFAAQRRSIGVKDTRVISGRRFLKAEPRLAGDFAFAMYNSSAGRVCPYALTIALAENAVSNGARVSLNTAVTGMEVEGGRIVSVRTNRGTLHPRVVINAAGVFAEDIARMAGDRFFSIHPRKGTNSILDSKTGGYLRSIATVRLLRQNTSHTKGGGIVHTTDDNLLVGPDAVETPYKEDFSTDRESIRNVFGKQRLLMPRLSEKDIITYFTGVRACTFEEDFILERGRRTSNIVHCAGIQSPGITAAPAFAPDIADIAREILSEEKPVESNPDFNPKRKGIPAVRKLPRNEREALIRKNPDYGVIICRCEEISKGEITDALDSPIKVPTLDGIKRRVRPGMGRCQGGFCSPLVMDIIAEHEGTAVSEVKKSGDRAFIAFGDTKGALSEHV